MPMKLLVLGPAPRRRACLGGIGACPWCSLLPAKGRLQGGSDPVLECASPTGAWPWGV